MNWFLIYLLSVAGPMQQTCIFAARALGFAAILTALIGVTNLASSKHYPELAASKREALHGAAQIVFARRAAIACIAAALVGSLVPTPNAVVTAYVMVEGSKIVNAPNAEKAAAAIVKRIDKVIDSLTSKP